MRSDEVFNDEGFKPELLLDYYEKHSEFQNLDQSNAERIFKRWCLLLASGFNIVTYGRQSKFDFIELFRSQYLNSGGMKAYNMDELVVVRLHGFTPIPLQNFLHALIDEKYSSTLAEEALSNFLATIEEKKTHYVFLLHSFELLHKECNKIVDLIFRIYDSKPNLIHIIMSVDQVNFAKLITRQLRQRLRLCFFIIPYVNSFFYERNHSVCIMDTSNSKRDGQARSVFEGHLDFRCLRDIHQALQQNCQWLMVHIIKSSYDRTLSNLREKQLQLSLADNKERRRSTRCKVEGEEPEVHSFEQLMKHYGEQFLSTRSYELKAYLEELKDHGIVSLDDDTWSKIRCEVKFETCKKFLAHVGAL